jgi:hypothetical protein
MWSVTKLDAVRFLVRPESKQTAFCRGPAVDKRIPFVDESLYLERLQHLGRLDGGKGMGSGVVPGFEEGQRGSPPEES